MKGSVRKSNHDYGEMVWVYLSLAIGLAAALGTLCVALGSLFFNIVGWHALSLGLPLLQAGAVGGSILFPFVTIKPVFDLVEYRHALHPEGEPLQIATSTAKGIFILAGLVGLVGAACLGVTAGPELGFAAASGLVGALLGGGATWATRAVYQKCCVPLRIYDTAFPKSHTSSELRERTPSHNHTQNFEPGTPMNTTRQHLNQTSTGRFVPGGGPG